MKISKEQMLLGGVAVLLLVIVVNSIKPMTLKEVEESSEKNSFDASKLPNQLQPPTKLNDGEELPKTSIPRKNFMNFSKPRFDR